MSTTIRKTFALLEILAERGDPWSVSELARRLDAPKSNVHFLLSALCASGYVEKEIGTRRYFLSLKLWELGSRVISKLDLRRIAMPHLNALAESTSEAVSLCLLDHDEVVFIHRIESSMPVRAHAPEGGRAPAYCTSTGKAMLAYQPEAVIHRVAARAQSHTEHTIVSPEQLIRELKQVKQLGYSINRGEWRHSVRGVGVPVFGQDGTVIAGIGIFGPAERLPYRRLEELAGRLLRTSEVVRECLTSGKPSLPHAHAASTG